MYKVISFYTPNWQYENCARLLKEDCERLGLDYYIEGLADRGSWIDNCRLKAKFIRDCLERFQEPVLWIDVDSRLFTAPPEIDLKYDMALVRTPETNQKTWQVSVMFFNYTAPAREMLRLWSSIDTPGTSDHQAFEEVWRTTAFAGVKVLEMSQDHCAFDKKKHDHVHVLVGRSQDESKKQYFRNLKRQNSIMANGSKPNTIVSKRDLQRLYLRNQQMAVKAKRVAPVIR
jgi:hypothetical protein